MTKRKILSKQSVKRKKKKQPKDFSGFVMFIKRASSLSLKILCLCIFVVSLSGLFLYLYQYLISSPYMTLEEVKITGVDGAIKRELIDMSGLDSELSLLTINLTHLKQKMERHPWVRKVELEKSFPDLLLIRAEKESPYAIAALDKLYYVNRQGELFKELEYNDDKDFPVITGILPVDKDCEHFLKLAAGILSVFESEKGAWSLKNLSEIHFEESRKVSLYSTSMPLVLKMGYDGLDEKKKELRKILGHLEEEGQINMVKSIDLDYADCAVVAFRDAG